MNGDFMDAILIQESGTEGDWNRLVVGSAPRPVVHAGEALVQVEACSVNRADLLQRRGLYPPPEGASPILGLDFAGFVVGTAADVTQWHPGDRVFGLVPGGGYGRYAAVRADHLVAIPHNLSFIEAAASAEVFFTAFLNLFGEANSQPNESLLLHGGGSGVGTAAIQLAAQAGLSVIITASSTATIERCLALGAAHGINYQTEDFAARVLELTDNQGVDVILDWIGAPYLERHLRILKPRGRLVIIGLMGGRETTIDLASVLTKRVRLIGSVLRSRSNQEKATLTRAFRERVIPLLQSGQVKPIVDRIYPVAEAEGAHLYMRDEKHFGKIVLSWQGSKD